MQCPRCRLVNPDTAQRCDCGYDFETKTVEISPLTPKQKAELTGVGGWLWWLAVGLTVFGPVNTLGAFGNNLADLDSPVMWIGTLLYVTLSVLAGVLVFRKNPLGIKLARLFLYVQLTLTALEALTAGFTNQFRQNLAETLAATIAGVLWLVYTYKSRRVALTFPTLKSGAKTLRTTAEVIKPASKTEVPKAIESPS